MSDDSFIASSETGCRATDVRQMLHRMESGVNGASGLLAPDPAVVELHLKLGNAYLIEQGIVT